MKVVKKTEQDGGAPSLPIVDIPRFTLNTIQIHADELLGMIATKKSNYATSIVQLVNNSSTQAAQGQRRPAEPAHVEEPAKQNTGAIVNAQKVSSSEKSPGKITSQGIGKVFDTVRGYLLQNNGKPARARRAASSALNGNMLTGVPR